MSLNNSSHNKYFLNGNSEVIALIVNRAGNIGNVSQRFWLAGALSGGIANN